MQCKLNHHFSNENNHHPELDRQSFVAGQAPWLKESPQISSKWSWPSRKSQSSAPTRGHTCFYILTTHSLSAGQPRWDQSQQCADIVWVLCRKGQSTRQGQIYTLSSHHFPFIHSLCSSECRKLPVLKTNGDKSLTLAPPMPLDLVQHLVQKALLYHSTMGYTKNLQIGQSTFIICHTSIMVIRVFTMHRQQCGRYVSK